MQISVEEVHIYIYKQHESYLLSSKPCKWLTETITTGPAVKNTYMDYGSNTYLDQLKYIWEMKMKQTKRE